MGHGFLVAAFDEKEAHQNPEQAEEAEDSAQIDAVVTAHGEQVHAQRGEELGEAAEEDGDVAKVRVSFSWSAPFTPTPSCSRPKQMTVANRPNRPIASGLTGIMGKSSFDEMGYETDLLASRYLKKAKGQPIVNILKERKHFFTGVTENLQL